MTRLPWDEDSDFNSECYESEQIYLGPPASVCGSFCRASFISQQEHPKLDHQVGSWFEHCSESFV